ncbi:MAG: Gfo/Idh/MocA family protein, partial [Acidimicrobiaceae bacterium]
AMSVKWGFIGAGWIANRATAPAVHRANNAQLFGVASRDAARSKKLEPQNVYDSYQLLLDDPQIDVVYISLANHQHLEWVTRSLEAGKHVLCEKPLGLNALEVQRMIECSKRCNCLLVEAVWSRWHPRFRRIVELVESGAIGDVKSIESQWGFKSEQTENYRLDPSLGGGALLDIGCYQANMWVALARGAADLKIKSVDRKIGPTKIDLMTKVEAMINDKTSVQLMSSFEKDVPQILKIEGSSGVIETKDGEAFSTWREPSSLRVNDQSENFKEVDAFVEMIEQVSEQITNRSGWVMPTKDSLRTAQILDQIIAS